jgi:cyclin A
MTPVAIMATNALRNLDGNEARAHCTSLAIVQPHRAAATREPAYKCADYVEEIIDHLLAREQTLHRDPNYLASQPDVTERMRIILVDWLIDVHLKFKLHPETFFLALDYVDRYLMLTRGSRSTLQLVGVCAMLIAAKHEEIWPPEVRECIYISANTYTRDEILAMERDIASTLNFRLCVPTPFPFMTRVLEGVGASDDVRHLASYSLDIAALEYGCLAYRPSRVAYATILIANLVVENTRRISNGDTPVDSVEQELPLVWNAAHELHSRTVLADMADVVQCARVILTCAGNVNSANSRYHAVRRKYTTDRFGEIATRYVLPLDL